MELACKLTDKVSLLFPIQSGSGSRSRLEPHGLEETVPDGADEIDLDDPVSVHLKLDASAVGPRLVAVHGLGRFHIVSHRHRWHIGSNRHLQASQRRSASWVG